MTSYRVGEMIVTVGSVKTDAGWVEDWVISVQGDNGRWYAETNGRGSDTEAGEFHAPARDVPLGVEHARELQGNTELPFELCASPVTPTS